MLRTRSGIGQPDALTFYFGQLVNLRFHQGRLDELSAIVAQEVENNPGLPSLQAALALLYCETGDPDEAGRRSPTSPTATTTSTTT